MRNGLIVFAAGVALIAQPVFAASGGSIGLTFSASVEPSSVTEPYAAHVLLHFHNSSSKTLWLYEPARDVQDVGEGGNRARDGAWLSVAVSAPEPAGPSALPGSAATLESRTMPRPRVIRLAPHQGAEEHVLIVLTPARTDQQGKRAPVWGRYTLTMTYGARFSNAKDLARDPGVGLWQGNVVSAPFELTLNPPAGSGSVSGWVFDGASSPLSEALVSLSDSGLSLLDQALTNASGRFSFKGLAAGKYWVTAREPGSGDSTDVVRHFVVSINDPHPAGRLMLLSERHYKASEVEHKPVILRVDDQEGRPVARAVVKTLAAPEPIVETLKVKTDMAGLALVPLLPGSVFVTVEKHGCRKHEERIDVGEPPGVDGFTLTLNCRQH